MKKYELFTLISLIIVISIPLLFYFFYTPSPPTNDGNSDPATEEQDNKNKEDEEKDKKKDKEKESDKDNKNNDDAKKEDKSDEIHWGVDSASYTDEEFLGCVVDNFGKPTVWGRYLGEKEGVSAGIDNAEVKLLHDNDIQLLIIYNHVEDARGSDNGASHAEEAIAMAKELEIPKGVAIFLDIEPNYPVDAAFMEGWYSTLGDSDYEPGVYGVFDEESELMNAFNSMEKDAQENMIVWTAYPQEEITTKDNAPEYNPQGPENAKVYGWQYAIDAETCNIDTNLFNGNMLEYLW
ncbi:glycoside hydrolase domain-containing protein [Ornithinibacillus californiensis]|uniref:glycoside hydrolase domain-containing protein n=1 Tax=Ornithinibacillus californiensis TaxID=161536 RepID=UPI00064D73DD|nr:glycoside hydrolase domain-containing protein [Ornithinibacillus californiensis]